MHIFKEFARVVGAKGQGVVAYLWPKTKGAAPSPKISFVKGFKPWGWIVGSGLYVDDVDALFWQQVRNLAIVMGVLLVMLIGGGIVIARGISLPLGIISHRMRALAGGDKTIDVPYATKRDEIGDLARALDVFKSQALEMDRMRDEQEEMRAQAERDKRAALERMADEFETKVGVIVKAVGSGATEMRDTANGMAQTADQTTPAVDRRRRRLGRGDAQRPDRGRGERGALELDRRDQPPGQRVRRDRASRGERGGAHQQHGA